MTEPMSASQMFHRLLPMLIVGLVLLARPVYRIVKGYYSKRNYIDAYDFLMILYGGCITALSISMPFAAQITDFLNNVAPYFFGALCAIVLFAIFVPKFYIMPKLYGTIGVGCEKMRFVREEARVGYDKYNWQMVEPRLFGLIWTPKHQPCNEHECNYFEVSR
jgi:hypothetical protein